MEDQKILDSAYLWNFDYELLAAFQSKDHRPEALQQ